MEDIKRYWTETLNQFTSPSCLEFFAQREANDLSDFEQLVDDVSYGCGCSKLVLIDRCNEWVLKIPFSDAGFDFCAIEAEIYQKAVKAGLEQMFAPSYYLMTYKGAPCYVMKKVDCNWRRLEADRTKRTSEGWSVTGLEERRTSWCRNTTVKTLLMYYYGEDGFLNLDSFLSRNKVNDIHNENVGYYENRLVLLDYSGYYDGSPDSEEGEEEW